VFTATGIRLSELAGIRYHPDDPARGDLDLHAREIRIRGKGGTTRTVKIGHQAARSLDRYIRARARHPQAHRPQLWLGVNNRGPLTAAPPGQSKTLPEAWRRPQTQTMIITRATHHATLNPRPTAPIGFSLSKRPPSQKPGRISIPGDGAAGDRGSE
jgi:site-specific recombinase XerD